MYPESASQRLNLISTQWSLVCRAGHASAAEAEAARQQLLERYRDAIRRYLRAVLHDADAADEIFQEFAVNLLHGGLRGANPQRGKFRNYVKGTLFHLIADYQKRQRKWPRPLPVDDAAFAAPQEDVEFDRQFVESWCDELLARAWAALAELDDEGGQPLYSVLRFRADHPEVHAPEMAERLTAQLGRPFTAGGVRQIVYRARRKFAEFLVGEVAQSLENPKAELADELVELGLLDYCRPALERRDLKM
jgi:RNA polymerase sigma-70 factor (ECF subfamily)